MSAEMSVGERIEAVLAQLRPYFAADGGDVRYVGLTAAGILQVKLCGACNNCPAATHTMHQGVLVAVQEVLPEVKGIEAV